MSYRTYLAVCDKNLVKHYREHAPELYIQKDEDDEAIAFYELVSDKFGRKDEFCIDGLDIPEDSGDPFFVNPNTQELFEHYNPRIVGKNECLLVIELMRQFVYEYYSKLCGDENLLKSKAERKATLWSKPYGITPYNLRENSKHIVCAMVTEYEVFEMVRMLKSIDWENDVVIFYGW